MSSRFLSLTLLLLPLTTCECEPVIPPPGHLDLDTILGPGEVRCGPIAKETELIGGPQAYAQVGRAFRCHNARIRFIIQDGSRPIGNSVYGGNIIDIDRVRDSELVDGNDTFREHVSALGAQEVLPETIEVINDGQNGQPGVIRVTGIPVPISLAPQANFLSQNLNGTLATDYILAADSDVIEITTTFFNNGSPLFGGLGVDLLATGAATPLMTPQFGVGELPLFSDVDFVAGMRGDGVNVGFMCDGKQMTVPVVIAGVTVPICDDALIIGSEGSFTRFMLVGDGSVDSIAKVAWQRLGTPTGTVTGTITGAATVVSALSGPLDDADSVIVNEAHVNSGAYSLTLPAGSYTLIAHAPGELGQQTARSAAVTVDVTADQNQSVDLTLGASGRIQVATSFGDGQARAAKLTLIALGDTQRGSAALGDVFTGQKTRYAVSNDGTFDVEVPPGQYRAFVTRGFAWSRFETVVDVTAGATVAVNASITEEIDTADMFAAEFHQHSLSSLDGAVPVPLKVLENAAEGIDIAVSTEHDNISDFRPHVENLGLTGQLKAFAGAEVSYQAVGHFNGYPWQLDDADPFRDIGSRMWWGKTVPQLFADIRAAGGDDIIIQLNHARSGATGVLEATGFDPSDGSLVPQPLSTLETLPPTIYRDWSPDFDAIEVNTGLGDVNLFTPAGRAVLKDKAQNDKQSIPNLADWFGLMNAGLAVAAMGNSDSHGKDNPVGYPRTFLLRGGALDAVDDTFIKNTIRAQRTAIGQGCLITLHTDGAIKAGVTELTTPLQELSVRLQAASHITVGRLEVYVNGLAQNVSIDGVVVSLDESGVLSLPLDGVAAQATERLRHRIAGLEGITEDAIVVAVSRGGSGLAPTGGGEVLCVSQPVYVDANNDAAFTPPFEATETVR